MIIPKIAIIIAKVKPFMQILRAAVFSIIITGIDILKNHHFRAVNNFFPGRNTNCFINNLTEHIYIDIDKLRKTFPITALITITYTDYICLLKTLLPYKFRSVDNSLTCQHHMLYNRQRTGSRWEILIAILSFLLCPAALVETDTVLTCKTGEPRA